MTMMMRHQQQQQRREEEDSRRGVGALLGPRVIGRLTPEMVLRSPQYMNCVNQYELDLRGNRITMIENLGTTQVREEGGGEGCGIGIG